MIHLDDHIFIILQEYIQILWLPIAVFFFFLLLDPAIKNECIIS